MAFFESIYINKYHKLMEQIETLNKRNIEGYNTFAEFCCAVEEMTGYFNELKVLERKYPKITVDSYEEFENTVFEELNKIYSKELDKIFDIFEDDNYSDKVEERLKKRLNKLETLKTDILNGYGHKCDKMLNPIIEDLNDKIKNYDRYKYKLSMKFSDDFDKDGEDPRLKDILRYIMKYRDVSISSIMEIYDLKVTRVYDILRELKNRDIIEEYNIGKPIRIKKYIRFVVITDNIIKMTDEEYEKQQEKIRREKMSLEDIMKLYNIEVDYSKQMDFNLINNSLIISDDSDSIMTNTIDYLLKYNPPEILGLILFNTNDVFLSVYDEVPNLWGTIGKTIGEIKGTLKLCEDTINYRYQVLVEKKVKSINELTDIPVQNIIIIVDEIYNLLKDKEVSEQLIRILLKGKRVGITCLFFTKFNKKNLLMGHIEDLVTTYNNYDIKKITDGDTKNVEVDNINTQMDGFDFEKYAANLLKQNGFENVEVTQYSGDFGVDIIAYKDDIKYAIQCKNYSSSVGIKAVQEVMGSKAMNDCHVAVVLTNNVFTKSAKELAKKNNVLLWDRKKLKELMDNISSNE